MKALNFEQIKNLVHGAARIEEGDGKISFFRFTETQQELYKVTCADFYLKTFATAGISIEFETNSENLALSVIVSPGSSRHFFTHSVFVNDDRIGELRGNIAGAENVSFKGEFRLGSGIKHVRILFPWSVKSELEYLRLDDRATVKPIQKMFKILMLGDSITQGYDASVPENTYAMQIVERLNAESRNKGIAGEQFFGRLAALKDDFAPDIITVAYGTNDWRHGTKERFTRECRAFFENLRESYPGVKIVAITPLWRADINDSQTIGEPLSYITEFIKQVSESVSDMIVIEGIDLIPHEARLYQSDGLHPIDSGFLHFGNNLWKKFSELVKNNEN